MRTVPTGSIGKQLYLALSGSLLLLWIMVVVAVGWVVNYETGEVFDSSLQETAQRVLPLALHDLRRQTSGEGDKSAPEAVFDVLEHDEYLVYQVFNRAGAMLSRSHAAPEIPLASSFLPGFYDIEEQRVYVDATRDGAFVIQVAERSGHRQETYRNVQLYTLLPLLGILPLAGLAVFWSVGLARRSIRKFDSEIASRGVNNLQPLAIEGLPAELVGVGESANRLLERLRLALNAERSFTANSAHELRTPLAVALAQLKVLENELADPAARERVCTAAEMLERLQRMASKLLQLSRAESGQALSKEAVDLSMLLALLLRDVLPAARRRIVFRQPEQPVWVVGDIDAMGIALHNLLENAERYGTKDAPLEIDLQPDGRVTFSNDCDVIPPGKLQDLCQRFVRASTEKTGTGLGLSIVQSIAAQSNAELFLRSPCYDTGEYSGRGFSAQLRLQTDEHSVLV